MSDKCCSAELEDVHVQELIDCAKAFDDNDDRGSTSPGNGGWEILYEDGWSELMDMSPVAQQQDMHVRIRISR